jgi:hypothetical protein
MKNETCKIESMSGKQMVVNKATGIQFVCDDCKGVIDWVKANVKEAKEYADVEVKLDGVELTFTLKDFKKRLGF